MIEKRDLFFILLSLSIFSSSFFDLWVEAKPEPSSHFGSGFTHLFTLLDYFYTGITFSFITQFRRRKRDYAARNILTLPEETSSVGQQSQEDPDNSQQAGISDKKERTNGSEPMDGAGVEDVNSRLMRKVR